MKYLTFILLAVGMATNVAAQPADTTSLKELYDRTINFSEEKLDSIAWYANYIEEQSKDIGFSKGKILATRLRGLHSDLTGNYDEAISYFLSTLTASREGHHIEYEISALSDLAIVYTEIKQPEKARQVYLECLQLIEKRSEPHAIISGYSNIAAIYNMLNNTDSALYYLTAALNLSNQFPQKETLPFIYNNTGNVYFKRKEYSKALEYFRRNKLMHDATQNIADLWVDHLNMGDCYLELGRFDSAAWYCQSALDIAKTLKSKSKEADSYALLAKLYEHKKEFKKAFDYQQQWHQIDTALVNESSSRTIAELQEKFNARDREKQNQLLLAEVGQAKLKYRYLSYLAIAAVIIGVLIGGFLLVYHRANNKLKEVNQVIGRQKEKLSALNQEKNSLISIVSHDLSSPFASIAMWSNMIVAEENFSEEQKRALVKIRESAFNGERLIRDILDIEKKGTSLQKIELEETDIAAFVSHVVDEHQGKAQAKGITLHTPRVSNVFLITDHGLMRRIIENLLSNAIKFSPEGKNIWVDIITTEKNVELSITDEGPGIKEEEKKLLFTKYAQLSAKPTAGEASTGLGLSIVKRLVNELNGQITCSTTEGSGTRFTIIFEK